jgi:hypothetical protein
MRIAPALRRYTEADLLRLIRDGRAYVDGDVIVPFVAGGNTSPLSNSFEGGTDGVALSTANTGGTSGDAANSVTNPTIMTFSNLHAAHGTLSMRILQTATPASTRCDWTAIGSLTTNVWFRMYVYLPASPASGAPVLMGIRDSATALCAELNITTGRLIRINTAGGAVGALDGTVALPLAGWCRIEFRCLANATTGEFEWRLYNTLDSTTPDETKSATGLNTLANIDGFRWGQVTNPVANFETFHDDVAVSPNGWIGPAGGTPLPVQQAQGGGSSVSPITVTLPNTPTVGNLLVACITSGDNTTRPTSISQTGVTWDAAALISSNNAGSNYCEIWVGVVGAGAGTAVTINVAGGLAAHNAIVFEVAGYTPELVDVTSSTTFTSTTTPTAGTVATLNANDLVIACVNSAAAQETVGPTGGFQRLKDSIAAVAQMLSAAVRAVSSTGSYSATWTSTPTTGAGCILTLKAPGSPTGPSGYLPKRLAGPAALAGAPSSRYTTPAKTKSIIRHIHVQNPNSVLGGTVGVAINTFAGGSTLLENYKLPARSVLDMACFYVLEAGEVIQDNGSTFFTITYDGEEYTP